MGGCWSCRIVRSRRRPSKETIEQFPDDSDYQPHEPRLPQESLEVTDQPLTLVVLPINLLLVHDLVSVCCTCSPCYTRDGKRQLSPSYSPLASTLPTPPESHDPQPSTSDIDDSERRRNLWGFHPRASRPPPCKGDQPVTTKVDCHYSALLSCCWRTYI